MSFAEDVKILTISLRKGRDHLTAHAALNLLEVRQAVIVPPESNTVCATIVCWLPDKKGNPLHPGQRGQD
jgi:hypothetical protein